MEVIGGKHDIRLYILAYVLTNIPAEVASGGKCGEHLVGFERHDNQLRGGMARLIQEQIRVAIPLYIQDC